MPGRALAAPTGTPPELKAIARGIDLVASNCGPKDFNLDRLRSDIALELWSSGLDAAYRPVRVQLRCLATELEITLNYGDATPPLRLRRPRGEGESPRSRERSYALVIAELSEIRVEQQRAELEAEDEDPNDAREAELPSEGEPSPAETDAEDEQTVTANSDTPAPQASAARRPEQNKRSDARRTRAKRPRAPRRSRTKAVRRSRGPWTRLGAFELRSLGRLRSLDKTLAGGIALTLGFGPSWQNKRLVVALRPLLGGEWSGSRREDALAEMALLAAGGEFSLGFRLPRRLVLELQAAGMAHLVWFRARLDEGVQGQDSRDLGAGGQWQLGLGIGPAPERRHGPSFAFEFGYAIPYPKGLFFNRDGREYEDEFSPGQFYIGLGFGWRFRI